MAVETESVEYDTFEVSTKKTSLRYSLEESEEIIPLTDIREEVIRRGTIRLEPVEVEDSVSSFSQSDSGLLTRLQHRRSTITEGEGLGIEQEFHSTQLRRLSRKATSRVVSDSSGRLVPIDDELVETILGVSSREFENELRACFNSHDNDKDGRISHHELYLCTYEQGFPFGKDAVRAVMEIAGSPDGTMDFSQFAKFNYDILNVQLELKQESENEGMSASGSLFRRPTKEQRRVLAAQVLKEEETLHQLFDRWDRGHSGKVSIADVLFALNKIPELQWSGSALRAGIRALLRYDDEANNQVNKDQFVYVINDVCIEELGVDFTLIAGRLLDIASA